MLEYNQSLLPYLGVETSSEHKTGSQKSRVIAVGSESESLAELGRLLDTLGVEVVATVNVQVRKIHPATYIGQGKLEEIGALVLNQEAQAVIMDFELTPNQLKNLEKSLEKPVLDRPGVIIEIFSRHARTKESKTQVELARLNYLLPRLAHFWTHFERQRGGIGMKGMGEKQIEVDRRLVKKRMSVLKERLVSIENERKIQRSARSKVLKVAIVGYTNAGKSTLLNALTHSHVLTENKLFATLDPSVRALSPDSHPPIVAIDTVGFISKLPHSLVASFKSTLEELLEADLLLHVVDGSSTQAREQYEITLEVLQELGADTKPQIVAVNKMDLVQGPAARNQARLIAPKSAFGPYMVSALDQVSVKELRTQILEFFQKGLAVIEVVLPYGESRLEALIHSNGKVESTKYLEKGTFIRFKMDEGMAKKLGLTRYRL